MIEEKLSNIEDFCKMACNFCNSNDWYCPTECDMLQKARKIGIERISKAYERNGGDIVKVSRYIKQAKIEGRR